jgi:hypothetical protein
MASGDLLALFTPLHNEPPASNAATLDVRNGHPVLDFDAATDESAVFTSILPNNYAGGGLSVYSWWTFTSDTNGGHVARIQVAIEYMLAGTLDIDADSFAAAQSGTLAVLTTSGILTTALVAFTSGAQMDSLIAGKPFRLKITRDADGTSGTDDATGDAELLLVVVVEP